MKKKGQYQTLQEKKTQHIPYSALGTQDLFGFRSMREGHQNLKLRLLAKPLQDNKRYGRLYNVAMHPKQRVHRSFWFFFITLLIQLSKDITQIPPTCRMRANLFT